MFPAVITSLETFDVRFPTSRDLDGSDAMNPDPDYSAAYVVIGTDAGDGLEGHGFAFTIGRGNDVQVAAIRALEPFVVGQPVDARSATSGARLVHDSQLRWLGPEKGVMHMAIARRGQRALGPRRQARGQAAVAAAGGHVAGGARRARRLPLPHRRAHARRGAGDPAARAERPGGADRAAARRTATPRTRRRPAGSATPTRSSRACARRRSTAGYEQIKLKVGANLDDDVRRLRIAREVCGPDIRIAVDANQRWDVDDAIRWIQRARAVRRRGGSRSRRAPTTCSATPPSGGRCSPIRIATGEHVQNRVVFKQLMQAEAIDVVQIDAARVAGRQREHRDPAARREVRAAGVPPRRRRRAVRAGPAPGDVRLRRRLRHARGPRHRVRRPPARALRRPGRGHATPATARRPPPGSRPR